MDNECKNVLSEIDRIINENMSDINYRIERRPNGFRLIGGRKNKLSPTGWSNFELDFKTEGELLKYIVKKTKLLIQEL